MLLGPKIRVYFSPTSLSNLFRTVGPLLPWSQNVFRLLQLVFRPLQIVFRRFGYPLPSTSSFYFFAIAASWIGAIVSPMIDRRKIYCFPPMITTMIFFSPATAANMVFLPFSPFSKSRSTIFTSSLFQRTFSTDDIVVRLRRRFGCFARRSKIRFSLLRLIAGSEIFPFSF